MKRQSFSPSTKTVAALAMLCAISIVLGKYLQIPIGDTLRFSFENLPIIFAGMAFGPACGMLTGAVADLVGCLLVGYAINPIVTLGAVLCGGVSGAVSLLTSGIKGMPIALRVTASVIPAHIIGSVLVKTFGLSKFYDMPLDILMLWRLLNYVIIGTLECVILTVLFKSPAVKNAIGNIKAQSKRPQNPENDAGDDKRL